MKLAFPDPRGLFGRFTTTRFADTMILPEVGAEIELCDTQGKILGIAELKDAWMGDLALVPASILEMEQNPLHRTYSGLIMGLRTTGPVGGFVAPNSKVTVLVLDFKRPSKIALLK